MPKRTFCWLTYADHAGSDKSTRIFSLFQFHAMQMKIRVPRSFFVLSLLSLVFFPIASHANSVWKEVGNDVLGQQRYYHSGLAFNNAMWMIGGMTSGGGNYGNVVKSTDGIQWTEVGTLPEGMIQSASTEYRGEMWLVGGNTNATGFSKTVYASSDGFLWQTESQLPYRVANHAVVSYDSFLWVIGGVVRPDQGSDYVTDKILQSFDGSSWLEVGTFPTPISSTQALSFAGKMWVIGGGPDQEGGKSVYASVNGINWELVGSLPYPSTSHSAVVHDGRMWVIGGRGDANYISATDRVFSSADGKTWRAEASLPIDWRDGAAVIYDNTIWLLGGDSRDVSHPKKVFVLGEEEETGGTVELAILDYSDDGILNPGQMYSKHLYIENTGTVMAHDVTVHIPIPQSLRFNQSQSSPGCYADVDDIRCGGEEMDYVAGADHNYGVTFDVPADIDCSQNINLLIGVSHAGSSDPFENSFSRTLTVHCSDSPVKSECSNGIDDNNDGNIDMDDASCGSPSQEREGIIEKCTDSDGGRDFFHRGEATGYINTGWVAHYKDYCGTLGLVKGKLLEYVCVENDYVQQEVVTCPHGCLDGICITPTEAPTEDTSPLSPSAGYEEEIISNPFDDVDPQTPEGSAAITLYREGIIGGFPDGEFKGWRLVNRAEASKFLLNGLGVNIGDLRNERRFVDVTEGEWYVRFVMRAANLGIIFGDDGKSTFRPADGVNTAEFLAMLSRTFNLETNLSHGYTDISSSDWFNAYAGIAWQHNLFPKRGTLLQSSRQLTRNEVALAIDIIRKAMQQ